MLVERILQQLRYLPDNLSNHLIITMIPLALSLAISLPLAILLVRRKSLRYPILTVVSVLQTIPSLALLALTVPVLAGVAYLSHRFVGLEFSSLGFYPTVIALTLYGILPMIRNTVIGILGVDPAMTEAARGLGMTQGQVLRKVELPLASPVIIAGIRTATVWIVGTATLATPVGQRCLGNYIFSGLQTRSWIAVIFGCVSAAVVAVVLDALIGALERAAAERRMRLAVVAGASLALIFGCGLVAPRAMSVVRNHFRQARASTADARESNSRASGRTGEPRPTIRIGSKAFTEQYILSGLLRRRLTQAGFAVHQTESLGSVIAFDALAKNQIDCLVDYTGTIWANYMKRAKGDRSWRVLAGVTGWLAETQGIRCLGPLGFENAYGLAMTRERAESLGVETITDLARHADSLKIGGEYEFFSRPEWESIRQGYGLSFAGRSVFDPSFMYEAVAKGEVDVISAFTTDGRIDAYDLVVLEDVKQAIPPYEALLLIAPGVADRDDLAQALAPLIGAIDESTMREANSMVDRNDEKQSIRSAVDFLDERIDVGTIPKEQSASPPSG